METYIALLRGINVSGQKSILMADLKGLFESLKFKNVRTYIQSGNVVFDSATTALPKIHSQIEKAIQDKWGFEVPTLVLSKNTLEKMIQKNPYQKLKLAKTERIYFSFLAAEPTTDSVQKLKAIQSPVDEIQIAPDVVYILCRGGYGKSIFSNTLVEKKLGIHSTTRNLETTMKLLEMTKANLLAEPR